MFFAVDCNVPSNIVNDGNSGQSDDEDLMLPNGHESTSTEKVKLVDEEWEGDGVTGDASDEKNSDDGNDRLSANHSHRSSSASNSTPSEIDEQDRPIGIDEMNERSEEEDVVDPLIKINQHQPQAVQIDPLAVENNPQAVENNPQAVENNPQAVENNSQVTWRHIRNSNKARYGRRLAKKFWGNTLMQRYLDLTKVHREGLDNAQMCSPKRVNLHSACIESQVAEKYPDSGADQKVAMVAEPTSVSSKFRRDLLAKGERRPRGPALRGGGQRANMNHAQEISIATMIKNLY
ncbi:hypothetical protein QAD02_000735 [Eretmocerus hayati]|uniref:Uncharacterized protein n=1 Tax=Eretmocerus hayati TaxID=131215 RepID=A0ACC2NFP0_9HYME|nr:hypothetical protein QAD02_000735 [Eretmocerus hayati]